VSEKRIDARGMRCPWPVIRLAKAIREGAMSVTIQADDPIAPTEIAAIAKIHGWSVSETEDSPETWHIAVNPALIRGAV
jgi:tRNA 2-thiouridine synthesizing protein A